MTFWGPYNFEKMCQMTLLSALVHNLEEKQVHGDANPLRQLMRIFSIFTLAAFIGNFKRNLDHMTKTRTTI